MSQPNCLFALERKRQISNKYCASEREEKTARG